MGHVVTAALLPTPGNEFVVRYWARNYARVWRGEVDELLVLVNGPDTSAAVSALLDVGARVLAVPQRVGHGSALTWLVEQTKADTIVLVEDDAYVRHPGAIREHLARAAAGEIIGSPRGGMHPLVEVAAKERWGTIASPDGSYGAGLWPCFLFARRDALLATDMVFEARWWQPGAPIAGLGYVPPQPVDTDTMTSVAFQLRDRHPITAAGQWKELGQKLLRGDPPWFHAGGLSNLDRMPREGCGDTLEGRDWAHRVWWWRRAAMAEPDSPARQRFLAVLEEMVRIGDLAREVSAWGRILEPWVTWDDAP